MAHSLTDPRSHPRLLRAEDIYYSRRFAAGPSAVALAEWAFRRHPPLFIDRPVPDLTRRGELDSSSPTQAEINLGRWVARCPFCPSAQVVSPVDPRFLCAGSDGCANAPVRGAFVPVVFPPEGMWGAIEDVLLKRPRPKRNWRPGETVAALEEENAAHGLDHP